MAEFFKSISSSLMPHVKICVSRRPLAEFDEAFKGLPSLRLQDLTFPDITAYVEEELASHRRIQLLPEAERAPLVSEIVDKAAGVFLWMTLVVRSLLNGLRNRDGIDDLRRRLKELPSGLSALYSHLLNTVEPLYQQQASQKFQIYDIMTRMDEVPSLLFQLAISATPQCINSTSWSPMKEEEIMLRCEKLEVHLKTRFGGLLEIHCAEVVPLSKVNYLHRAVREFLISDEVRGLMTSTGGPDFNPYTSIMFSFILVMKKTLEFFRTDYTGYEALRIGSNTWTCVRPAFKYAREAEISGDKSYIPVLEELERVAIQRWKQEYADSGKDWREAEVFDRWRIFWDALSHGLASYAVKKLDENESLIMGWQDIPLLFHALDQHKYLAWHNLEIIGLLLQRGEDPNWFWNGKRPWKEFLGMAHAIYGSPTHREQARNWAQVFKLFLQSGANPLETCNHHRHNGCVSDHAVTTVIRDLFSRDCPREAEELTSLWEAKTRAYQ